jgi:hypothetical protein
MSATVTHLHSQSSVEELVTELVDLNDQVAALDERRATIKAQLAQLPPDTYVQPSGVKLIVKAPARRFDADRAYAAMSPEAQALCTGPIPAKVKAHIPPALLDQFMVAGNGSNTVTLS